MFYESYNPNSIFCYAIDNKNNSTMIVFVTHKELNRPTFSLDCYSCLKSAQSVLTEIIASILLWKWIFELVASMSNTNQKTYLV